MLFARNDGRAQRRGHATRGRVSRSQGTITVGISAAAVGNASQMTTSRSLDSLRRFHNHGNMKTDAALAALAALSQRTRLDVFRFLVEAGPEGAAVGSIADALRVPAPPLSFHLKELSHAELVTSKQEGRFIRYAANFAAMSGLVAYLTENCCRGQPDLCVPSCAPKKSSPRRKRVPA